MKIFVLLLLFSVSAAGRTHVPSAEKNGRSRETYFKRGSATPFRSPANKEQLISDSVRYAMEDAYSQCRRLMEWEKWDCRKDDFDRRHTMYGTKEHGFVESMIAASVTYRFFRECYQGKYDDCMCKSIGYYNNEVCPKCMEPANWKRIMEFIRKTVKKQFLPLYKQGKNSSEDTQYHNMKIGINIVKRLIKNDCSCFNMPGSCMFQPSSFTLTSFDKVGDILKQRWKNAALLGYDPMYWSKVLAFGSFYKDTMVYTKSSSYCHRNETTGTQGTVGRACMKNRLSQIDDPLENEICHNLCFSCGYGVERRIEFKETACRCIYTGCCNEICETCSVKYVSYYCS